MVDLHEYCLEQNCAKMHRIESTVIKSLPVRIYYYNQILAFTELGNKNKLGCRDQILLTTFCCQ